MEFQYTKEEQKQHRQEWVAALRSGDYRQVRGLLRQKNSFCCLGIACDISGLGKWKSGLVSMAYNTDDNNELSRVGVLPDSVQDYYGLSTKTGRHHINTANTSLSGMNDRGLTFNDIADLIENEPEGLVV